MVVGSGAGGLTTAITAASAGPQSQKVLVAEKSKYFGGTSAFSGGALWVPLNPNSIRDYPDTREAAETYLRHFLKNIDHDPSLAAAYLDSGPEMVAWLEEQSAAKFVQCPTPDYYMEVEGALRAGRTILNAPYDGRRLGKALVKQVRYPLQGYCAFGSMQADLGDLGRWTAPFSSLENFAFATRSVIRYALDLLRFGKGTYFCNGNALVGRLLESATEKGVDLWNNAAATKPILDGARIAGVCIKREGQGLVRVRARKGVVLASGGFSRNAGLARKYLPATANTWTASPRSNQGDGIGIGVAGRGHLPPPLSSGDPALWTPISEIPTRRGPNREYPHFAMGLTKPGSIIVDDSGNRFANESAPYQDLGKATIAAGIQQHFLIGTKWHLRKYGMGAALPAPYPVTQLVRSGYLVTAPDIPGLAHELGIDPQQLSATVERFNAFAREGKDHDFHRGEASFDIAHGNKDNKPNPCLAPLDQGSFYAVRLHAGNGITLAGLDTNKDAQVLNAGGRPVEGLYAVGADANHFLQGRYPSGGLTLGPAMVFGYRAGLHLARE